MSSSNGWLSFIVALCICALTLVQCASIRCQNPSNLTLHDRFKRANGDTHTILLMPSESTMEVSAAFMGHEHLYAGTTCPDNQNQLTTEPLDDRSTCPFSNMIDHNPKRYPLTLTKAVCRCDNCFGLEDNDTNHHCEHLVYNIQVLMRTDVCVGGFYVYEEEWYPVSVGCVCARRPKTPSPTMDISIFL